MAGPRFPWSRTADTRMLAVVRPITQRTVVLDWSPHCRYYTDFPQLSPSHYPGVCPKGSQAPEPETTENRPDEIGAYWNKSDADDEEINGNLQAGYAGIERFSAFCEQPKRADEWEAEVEPEYGASNVSPDPASGVRPATSWLPPVTGSGC